MGGRREGGRREGGEGKGGEKLLLMASHSLEPTRVGSILESCSIMNVIKRRHSHLAGHYSWVTSLLVAIEQYQKEQFCVISVS